MALAAVAILVSVLTTVAAILQTVTTILARLAPEFTPLGATLTAFLRETLTAFGTIRTLTPLGAAQAAEAGKSIM
ncbi:MAG: hypothetical protein JHC88_17910, partial [Niveispirillum sp.]|nr:hypothetical protein [Niveispirillum sp.]